MEIVTYRLSIDPKALVEMESLLRYYHEVAPATVARLEEALRAVRQQITSMPNAYQVFHGFTRRAHLRPFPYTLYYRVVDKEIEIAAVMPQRFGAQAVSQRLNAATIHHTD